MGFQKNFRKCPECGGIGFIHKTGDYETVFFERGKERKIVVRDVDWDECVSCGVKYLDHLAIAKITEAKYRAQGLFAPVEIKKIRECLGLSQREMSNFIKVGEKTYTRWENGTYVQTKAHNETLRNIVIQYDLPIDIIEEAEERRIREKVHSNVRIENICKKGKTDKDYSKNFKCSTKPQFFTPRLHIGDIL